MQFKAMIQGDAIRAVQLSVDRTHSLGLDRCNLSQTNSFDHPTQTLKGMAACK